MKLKTVKTATEVALKGVKIELDIVDKDIRGVTITDADGKFFRVQQTAQYSQNLSLQVPDTGEEEKFCVEATLYAGYSFETRISRIFDTQQEAEAMKLDLEAKDAKDIKVERVKVQTPANDVAADSDIPF